MHSNLELLRLARAVDQARDRLTWITRLVPDAAVLMIAEDLCAEATEAVEAYRTTHAAPQKT
jgi:hypothetical protein